MAAPSIPVVQGGSLQVNMLLQLDDGTPVDLTGATISCVFQDPQESTTQTATVVLTAATGAAMMSLTGTQTAALPAGLVFGQVQITTAAGIFYSDSFPLSVSQPIGAS